MLQPTPEQTKAFLYKRVQVVVECAKDSDSRLPPGTVTLIEAWGIQFVKVFGLDERGSMDSLLQSMPAVTAINDLLIGLARKIQDHESIMDEEDPTKLDLLYDPAQMLAYFRQQYSGVTLSLGRIVGRHARVLEVATCGQAREGGYHYRF